jgi:hypothetical protein
MAARRQRFLKRSGLLLAALGLFAAGGALMLKPAELRRERAALPFPRNPRPEELERQERRRTFAPQRAASDVATPGTAGQPSAEPESAPHPEAEQRFDPLQLALAGSQLGLVLEARALQESPLGRMLLGCLSPDQTQALNELEQKTGLHPLRQIERVAISGEGSDSAVLMLGGQFAGFDPSALNEQLSFEPLGEDTLWAESGDRAIASWKGQLLLVGDAEGVRTALTRLEQPPSEAAAGLAGEAYGEVYGSLTGQAASRMLPPDLRERFARAAERVTLHVDARDDLLLVADVYGPEQEPLRDLASMVGGALALGRLHAVRSEDPMLAELLDESRVIPGDGSFQVEMALPLVALADQLGECARQPRANAPIP